MRVYTGCPRPGLRSAPRTRLVSGENSRQPEAQTALRGLCWLPGVSWPQLGMWLGDLGPGPAHHLPMAQGGCWPWGKGHRPPCPLADPDPEQWGGAAPPSEPAGGLRWTPPTGPLRASALRAARHWAAPPGTREVRRGHTCLPSLGQRLGLGGSFFSDLSPDSRPHSARLGLRPQRCSGVAHGGDDRV